MGASETKNPKTSNHEEILIFEKNRFLLNNVTSEKVRRNLSKDPRWKRISETVYTTTHLGAAHELRENADLKVEKIFKKRLQEFYEMPWPPLPQVTSLDPHQHEGIEWILTRKRSYLAHAPGAGKTAQAILASVAVEGLGPVLFIVPPSLTLNWEREIWKFTEMVDVFPTIGIVPRSDKQEETAWRSDFIICPDSMLTRPWVYEKLTLIPWKFIAVDEASRFKDPLSERTVALFGGRAKETTYRGLIQNARHVVLLDGSPMPNRPIELWAPAYAMDPQSIDFMDYDDFGYRYCGARPNDRGVWEYLHSSNEAVLKAKLQKSFMHVVAEHQLSHPERRRSIVFTDHDVRSPEHREWERDHLSGLTDIDENASQGDFARYRKELGVRKIPWIASYVKERLREKSESLIVFAWHREVVEGLEDALSKYTPGVVMGGTPNDTREHLFDLFNRGIVRVLIMNIAAGGRGHNLQRADRIIFGEFSWTDEMNRQCEKRASRKGSEKAFVRCEYIVSPGSMDEVVLSSVFTKEKRVRRIIG